MSISASLKVGPFTSNVLVRKRYLLYYLFLFWSSLFIVQYELWFYFALASTWEAIWFLIFLPIIIVLMYFSLVLISIFLAKILLIIVNMIHPPKEGTFLRDISDKDYRFWSIRNTIKKWPTWLAHKFPFPFLDNICFKLFGVKTKFSNSLFEGWVDTEFIEFGNNVVVGQSSIIQSSIIIGNLLIIRKTVIGDNVRIGAHSIVMPGTKVGENTILAASSTTHISQELDAGWVYLGVPAKKGTIASLGTVGMAAVVTNKGCLCHPKTTPEEVEQLEKVFDVDVMIGTVNHGFPMIGSGLVANSNGAIIGNMTTGIEMGRIEEALGFLD